ncbi:MAG: hypothetical protein RLZZ303_599 [Candidatus Hydrogenedentota bacterium]|jgi:NAD(P)-dependent dehydrogenase (short-subunit alcohol dehydrogenase family)
MPELVDKIALVTGASSGIGQATAVALARAGAWIAATGRDAARLQPFTDFANSQGGHVQSYAADLSSEAGCNALADWALDTYGGIDVLVHAAGMASRGASADTDRATFDAMLRINVLAAGQLVQRLAPSLIARGGQIAFINSRAGLRVFPQFGAYCASKFALKAYADTLREELRPKGVRVVSVFPGKVDTPMQRQLNEQGGLPHEPERYLRAEDVARATVDALLLPRGVEIPDVLIQPARE